MFRRLSAENLTQIHDFSALKTASRMLNNDPGEVRQFSGSGFQERFKVRSASPNPPWNQEPVNQERGGRPPVFFQRPV
jgi:hypothetical protein